MKRILSIVLLCVCPLFAQTEVLTNSEVIEMAQAGLGAKIILEKIKSSVCEFDASARSLIELKKVGVDDEVISEIIEKSKKQRERVAQNEEKNKEFVNYSESQSYQEVKINRNPLEVLQNAKSIALRKSSLHPARQNLEKALLKREEWRKYNLTLTEFEQNADLFIEIGRVPLTLFTHRYVFRIVDSRSGIIIAAGETTSWGSLAENLARVIVKSLKDLEKK